ncbi:AMP-binding protein [Rhodococcus pyridinivorans]|uniref:AMP-binding protein n=1 Tax=Rhodococcus pyridinivorans TaxID=103816 RepID=UPI0019042BE1|nr:AMP-binding protein [Rhodococcus pyridinivorans]QQM53098.1 AMP-binding protein [Rhodococcus pyridinivorans]
MSEQDGLSRLLTLNLSDRTAIEWRGRQLTYCELAAAVDELSRTLGERGATRSNVLVLGPLCPAYVVGLLATLRSGAVPVPVDAGMSVEQYAWAEGIAQPSTVLTSDVSTVAQYQGTSGADELVLDAVTGRVVLDIASRRRSKIIRRYPVPDVGYLIPTSGSTGAPKAIVGSRTGLHGFLSWFVAEFGLDRGDVCAAVTRVNFDPSLRELLAVLAVGGKLSLPEVDAQLDFQALADHLITSKATIAFLVPSLSRRIADVLSTESARLDHLRLGFFAGEVLPPRVVEQWTALAPDAEFVNLYGMTEGTLAQLFKRDIRGVGDSRLPGMPVGRPRPGVSVTIDQPDSAGRGEVLIASSTPALGTLIDGPGPEPGTFHVEPMAATLRTGDSGFLTEQSELVISGRLGNDLKVSGRRVSFHRFVDEVEEVPGVRQCVVVDWQGPQAFISVAEPADAQQNVLRAAVHGIAQRLGLPRPAVHVRGDLPLLRSGKVDRVTLASSVADTPNFADTTACPDAGVAETMRGFLGLDSDTTSFVDAGLTSLDMIQFILEVNKRFRVNLSVQDCFGHRDVASLARVIERATVPTAPATTPSAARDYIPGESDTYPLSTRQQAYMAICMTDGNANWCNISREIRIERTVIPAEAAAAVDALIARHDALRLSLTADWTRQIHTEVSDLSCPITVHDGTGVEGTTDVAHRARVQQARVLAVSELLDPSIAPPFRVVLVQGSGTTSLLVVAHHLFIDGLSLDLIATELRSLLLGQPIGDAPPSHGYRDYCLATERVPEAYTPDALYWRDLLKGAAQVELPETSGEDARVGVLVSRPFGVTGTRAANRLAAASGVSVFSVVLAAFEMAVSRTFGLGPLTVVVPVQVRQGMGAASAGMFTSQLVVRSKGLTSLPDSAREFARQLEAGTTKSSWEFDQRVTELGLVDADCFPLSTVLFNQHPRQRGLRVRELGEWQPRSLGRALRYQLQGELQVSAAEMVLTYYYRRGIAMERANVIDRLHASVLATLCEMGGTLRAE